MSLRHLKLTTGDQLPAIGLGLWKVEKPAASALVEEAARCGYRHFDCASDYGNEADVGAGLRKVLDSGICPRDDLWVTSKPSNSRQRK